MFENVTHAVTALECNQKPYKLETEAIEAHNYNQYACIVNHNLNMLVDRGLKYAS